LPKKVIFKLNVRNRKKTIFLKEIVKLSFIILVFQTKDNEFKQNGIKLKISALPRFKT
jgi:hypothetical protein